MDGGSSELDALTEVVVHLANRLNVVPKAEYLVLSDQQAQKPNTQIAHPAHVRLYPGAHYDMLTTSS